ncbi:MAG: energy-coupling factor ABC transporter permease [Planctomycetota bacterium]
MHISDGVLSGIVSASCGVAAFAGCAICVRQFRRTALPEQTPRMGLVAAFIFAAQMVNFPLGFAPISGHLMGGTLAAVLLGPWGGGLVMASVLIVQAVLMGDGALTALGANWLNMGLIGSVASASVLSFIMRAGSGRIGVITATMLAAWFSVILSAAAFSLELAFSSGFGSFGEVLAWMVLVHCVIALGEALITGMVLRGVVWSRPDFIHSHQEKIEPVKIRHRLGWLSGGLTITAAILVFLAPLASSDPDGLEFIGKKFGFLPESESTYRAPFPDYSIPGLPDGRWSTVAAGLIGTTSVFVAGWWFSSSLARQNQGSRPGLETNRQS